MSAGPVHQPGTFNIEAYSGGRWHGGMNRLTQESAIATARTWAAQNGLRHRVFDLDGKVIFDTDAELVARAVEILAETCEDGKTPIDRGLLGIRIARLEQREAAGVELIEAVSAFKGKRGAFMALGAQDPRTVRLWAALAAVEGRRHG